MIISHTHVKLQTREAPGLSPYTGYVNFSFLSKDRDPPTCKKRLVSLGCGTFTFMKIRYIEKWRALDEKNYLDS